MHAAVPSAQLTDARGNIAPALSGVCHCRDRRFQKLLQQLVSESLEVDLQFIQPHKQAWSRMTTGAGQVAAHAGMVHFKGIGMVKFIITSLGKQASCNPIHAFMTLVDDLGAGHGCCSLVRALLKMYRQVSSKITRQLLSNRS